MTTVIDQKTSNRQYDLPNEENQLTDDVGRLRAALASIDADVAALLAAVALKAARNSAALTGTPTAPTASTTTNTDQIATTAFVQSVIAELIDAAPEDLDTLREIAVGIAGLRADVDAANAAAVSASDDAVAYSIALGG